MENKITNILSSEINSIMDINELNDSFNEISSLFESRKRYLNMLNEAAKLENTSFSFIKEAFEGMTPELYNTTEGRNLLKRYINEVQSNETLSKMYSIYENVYHAPANIDDSFMSEAIMSANINRKEYTEATKKLASLLSEAFITLNGNVDFSFTRNLVALDESIDALVTSKRNLKNIAEDTLRKMQVEKYISENKGTMARPKFNKDNKIDALLEDFNAKYSDSEHADLIKNVLKDNGELFESYKSKCLTTIKETLAANENHVDADRLHSIYEAVEKKTFNKETIASDIANFIELTKMVED